MECLIIILVDLDHSHFLLLSLTVQLSVTMGDWPAVLHRSALGHVLPIDRYWLETLLFAAAVETVLKLIGRLDQGYEGLTY